MVAGKLANVENTRIENQVLPLNPQKRAFDHGFFIEVVRANPGGIFQNRVGEGFCFFPLQGKKRKPSPTRFWNSPGDRQRLVGPWASGPLVASLGVAGWCCLLHYSGSGYWRAARRGRPATHVLRSRLVGAIVEFPWNSRFP